MQVSSGVALAVALFGAGLALPAQPAAKPTQDPAERAAAIVAPAVVYLETDWRARVRSRGTGTLYDDTTLTVTTRCTGFAVSGDGYLVTAGRCVDAAAAAPAIYAALADRLEQTNRLVPSGRAGLLTTLRADALIEGEARGEPPVRAVYAQRGTATPGRTDGEAMAARVVDVTAVGDIALVKVEKANQPMITVSDSDTATDATPVFAIGYPTAQPVDDRASTVNRTGTIAGQYTVDGQSYLRIDAPTTSGMEGAPLANLDGAAIGLLSRSVDEQDGPPVLASSASLITAELARNGVHNELGRIDRDYRAGLDDFYAGRYTEAIAKFDAVLALMPSHALAQEYQQKAVSLRQSEGEPPDHRPLLLGAAGGGGLLILAVLAVLFLRRRRHAHPEPARPGPAQPAAGEPAPQPEPVLRRPPPPSMRYCPNCGHANDIDATACATCGRPS